MRIQNNCFEMELLRSRIWYANAPSPTPYKRSGGGKLHQARWECSEGRASPEQMATLGPAEWLLQTRKGATPKALRK